MQVGFLISRQEAIGQHLRRFSFGLDLSAEDGQAARFLNVGSAPLDLACLIRSGRHMFNGISYLEIAMVAAFEAGCRLCIGRCY